MSLHEHIAEHFGQNSEGESLEKQASIELFCKLAEEDGIDLDSLAEEKVAELYNAWRQDLSKEAGDEGRDGDGDGEKHDGDKNHDDKKDKAKAEFEKKKEASEKIAEGRLIGEVMADAYVARLQKHAEANGLGTKEASAPNGTLLEKQASSTETIDEIAAHEAFRKAAEAGFDTNQAADRINAVLLLGPGESDKVASCRTAEEAVDIRSLEILEMAGYPVNY